MSTLCNCYVTLCMALSIIKVIYGQNLTACENITQGTNSSSELDGTNNTICGETMAPSNQMPNSLILKITAITISIIGMIGNSLTITVLLRRQVWTSISIIIFILSMADMLALLTILCLQFMPITPLYFTFHFSVLCSSSCLVIISSERSIAIRHPLKYREKWNRSTTIKLVMAATIFNILLIASTIVAREYLSFQFFNRQYFGTFQFVTRTVPFSVILVTNILMIKGLHDNTKRLIEMSSKGIGSDRVRKEASITRTILSMTILYFVSMVAGPLWQGFFIFGIVTFPEIYTIGSISELVNFSCNFCLYILTSEFYRKGYKALFCSCFRNCRNDQTGPITQP